MLRFGTIENVVTEWLAYGYRRVTHELRRRGIVVNHKRVARIMREQALAPRRHAASWQRPIRPMQIRSMRTWLSGSDHPCRISSAP